MLDVLEQRLALVVLGLVLMALRDAVDRCAVQRSADLAGEERAVVVRVVPRQPALVARVLPEGLDELDRLEGALRVDRDLLARLVDLGAAEVPQERIAEGRRIAEAVPERLSDWLALGLELLAGLAILVPRLRKLLEANFVEPRSPVGDRVSNDAVGHGEPLAADLGARVEHVIEAGLTLTDRLGDVRDVDESVGVELRPVPQHLDDVGAAARLHGGGDARL